MRAILTILFTATLLLQSHTVTVKHISGGLPNTFTASTDTLPRSAPESQGVSSPGILRFLEAADKSSHQFHSFMMLRHGRVIAEGWWNPYRPDLKHTLYSVSKSFTSTAIGFAVQEKRLTVTDKVISFFPKELPGTIPPHLAALTIKDLLTMSTGQEPDPTFTVVRDSNWVRSFLAWPIVHTPGTKFMYNTLATYMLSAIIQKISGEKLIDYLRPRLFEPQGIRDLDWEIDSKGINTGGWGLRLKTEDMAKFGQLYLQKGRWNGRKILPAAWITAATSRQIDQAPAWVSPETKKDTSDWAQGYGYQFWRCRHGAYRADGAFGQYIIVLPAQDAVVVITSETADMQQQIKQVWNYLLPAIQGDELPANAGGIAALKQKLSSLALPPPTKSAASSLESGISGKTFTLAPNDKQIESMSFRFTDGNCQLILKTNAAEHMLAFGSGAWNMGETTKPGPSLVAGRKAHFAGLPPSQIAGSYRWTAENTLELTLRYIESPHTETMLCRFDQNNMSVNIQNRFDLGGKQATLTGKTNN